MSVSLSMSFHVCLSLPFHVCLSLSLSLFMSLSLSLHMSPCGCGFVVWLLCVCVPSCLALKNASVCTFKTLPCVPSKRPCQQPHNTPTTTGRHVKRKKERVSLTSHTSLSSHTSLFSLFSVNNSFNNKDNDRSSSWLSVHTVQSCLRARVRGPWPIPYGLTCSHHARNNCPSVTVQASCHLE